MEFPKPKPQALVIFGVMVAGILGVKLISRMCQGKVEEEVPSNAVEKVKKKDLEAMKKEREKKFVRCMHAGERCLAEGRTKEAVQNFVNAFIYCSNKERLDQILFISLPRSIYELFQNMLKAQTGI